ncbi:hypothetical protein [Archangium lipolyticum]|uniref:hypothetical protein n=1 Tax=Archangium lipolyticum TaxID=2970465 RepID=UPI00214A3334|nr:hypothetical protein [Archangium lipolyticum]
MSVRTLLLVLSTSTLSILTGCATSQTASREDAAASTTPQVAQGELKACRCSRHASAEDGSAQAAAGKGCQCPHCSYAATADAEKKPACGCGHHGKGNEAQVQDGVP